MGQHDKTALKEFILKWLAEDGSQIFLGTILTCNPKDALFNEICRMLVIAPNHFKIDDNRAVNIRKLIKTGESQREHYFAEINNQVLSIMEANFHQTPDNE